MKQCLKIAVSGKVQGVGYLEFVKKAAEKLTIEGTIQHDQPDSMTLHVCGDAENLTKLIDLLYSGTKTSEVHDVAVEPLVSEKDFRGVFRIIGQELPTA